MSNIHIDDYGVNRPFDDEIKQLRGVSKNKIPGGGDNSTPPTSINDLPFDIDTVLLNAKYAGTVVNNVINLPSTDFVTYGGLIWIKALTDTTPHAFFNIKSGFGQMLNLPLNNPLTLTDNNEIYDLTKTSLILKGNAAFTNKAGIDYQLIGLVNRRNFFFATTLDHVTGQSEKLPMAGRINNVGAVIIKSNTASNKWMLWHRSLSNGRMLTFNSAYPVETSSVITLNTSNEIVIDPNMLSGEYSVFVFGHSPDGSYGIFADTYNGADIKFQLPFESGLMITKLIDQTIDENTSDPWIFLSQSVGWYKDQNDNFVTEAAEAMTSGPYGHPLTDGIVTPAKSGDYVFIAIEKNTKENINSGTTDPTTIPDPVVTTGLVITYPETMAPAETANVTITGATDPANVGVTYDISNIGGALTFNRTSGIKPGEIIAVTAANISVATATSNFTVEVMDAKNARLEAVSKTITINNPNV